MDYLIIFSDIERKDQGNWGCTKFIVQVPQIRQLSLDPSTPYKVGRKVKTRGMIGQQDLLLVKFLEKGHIAWGICCVDFPHVSLPALPSYLADLYIASLAD